MILLLDAIDRFVVDWASAKTEKSCRSLRVAFFAYGGTRLKFWLRLEQAAREGYHVSEIGGVPRYPPVEAEIDRGWRP